MDRGRPIFSVIHVYVASHIANLQPLYTFQYKLLQDLDLLHSHSTDEGPWAKVVISD